MRAYKQVAANAHPFQGRDRARAQGHCHDYAIAKAGTREDSKHRFDAVDVYDVETDFAEVN